MKHDVSREKFIKMRNKPEFGVFSLQLSPRLQGGVGGDSI